jgi:methyl-accepting chemotaxis protein
MTTEKKIGLLRGLAFILALAWVIGLIVGINLSFPYTLLAGLFLVAAYIGAPIVAYLLSIYLSIEKQKVASVVFAALIAPVITLPVLGLMQHRVKRLIKVLKNPKASDLYIETSTNLRDIKDVHSLGPLIQSLPDQSENIRELVVLALRNFKDVRAVDALIWALQNDESARVRMQAASALAVAKDTKAIEPLKQAVQDQDQSVQKVAKEALEYFEKNILDE